MQNKVIEILNSLNNQEGSSKLIKKNSDWLTFLISLLPLPLISEGFEIANKIIADKELKITLEQLVAEFDERFETINSELETVKEMSLLFNSDDRFKEKVEEIIIEISEKSNLENEVLIETDRNSIQKFVNQIIESNIVNIDTKNRSSVYIDNSKINAEKVHLKATDNSINHFENSTFTSKNSTVDLTGVSQEGKVSLDKGISFDDGASISGNGIISGSGSISYGENAIHFGREPDLVGNCSECGTQIAITNEEYKKMKNEYINCPNERCNKKMFVS